MFISNVIERKGERDGFFYSQEAVHTTIFCGVNLFALI